MKVFITGGCGQVGSHVAEALLARGDRVVVIDNFATGRAGHLAPHERLTVVEGSIADRALVHRLVDEVRPEVLIHTAASYKDPDDWLGDAETNVIGMVHLIAAARRHGVKRFLYFQTALCYGVRPLEHPITLNHPKRPGNSSYAISKTAAEDYLELSGLDFVSFRLANVIGPRNLSGPLPIFYQRLTEGKRCFVTPARRDFVSAADLTRVVLQASDGTGHGAYHFSSGGDIAIRDLYDAVVTALGLGVRPEPELRPLAADDAPSILLDPQRTLQDFGALSFTPLAETVARAVAYYRAFGVGGGYTHLKSPMPA
jgi:nucleoside-diphosphate-sugar epimerase